MEIIIAFVVVLLGAALYLNRKPQKTAVATSTVADTVTTVVENKVEVATAVAAEPVKKAPAKKVAKPAAAKKAPAKKAPAKKAPAKKKTVKK
jgi:hypothetical protein